jgi:four helix bundle protein
VPSEADELAARAKTFAIRVVKFVKSLPYDAFVESMLKQLVKSATGESANYHAARRSRTRAEFVAKIGTVAEEADESEHWLGMLHTIEAAKSVPQQKELAALLAESRELRAIFVQSAKTARANYERLRAATADAAVRRRRFSNPKILKS